MFSYIILFLATTFHVLLNILDKKQQNQIFRAPIARMKMILRPVESQYHFLSSDSVKPSKQAV